MRKTHSVFMQAALASAIAVTLTACGGSTEVFGPSPNNSNTTDNSDSNSTQTPTAKVAVSGAVADGYLQGAKACLDLNRNKACDEGEPFAVSGNGGRYSLEVPEGIDAADYPVVVEVGADAIDEDDGQPVGKPYVLSAPPGKPEFVSPITTMIHSTLEQNPNMSVEDAENELKTNMGVASGVSLFKDYVSEKRTGSEAGEYERVHRIAQVVATVLEENISEVKDAASAAGLDPSAVFDKLVHLVVNQVIEKLNVITQKVDDRKDDASFSANTIRGEIKQDVKVETSTIKDDVKTLERVQTAAVLSMREILKNGVNWFEAWPNCKGDDAVCGYEFEHGRIGLSDDGGSLVESKRSFDLSSLSWTPFEHDRDEVGTILGASGWIERGDAGTPKIAFHDDNSATLTFYEGADQVRVKGAVLEIAGESVHEFAPMGKREWFLDHTFSSGARAYRWTFTQLGDLFEIDHWNDGDTCYDGKSASEFGGNCNTVWGYASMTTQAPAMALSEVIYPSTQTTNGESAAIHLGPNLRARLFGDPNDLSKGGVVRFKEAQSMIVNPDGTKTLGAELEIKNEAPWKARVVKGQTLVEFAIPAYLREKAENFDRSPNVILATHNGWVRVGSHTPKGFVESERSWNFNDIAAENLNGALNTSAEFRFDNPHYNPGNSSNESGSHGGSTNDSSAIGGTPKPNDETCYD
ncbi:MAG: hypothetical protein ACFCUJ_06595, partial [Thiotrichales bacterium]